MEPPCSLSPRSRRACHCGARRTPTPSATFTRLESLTRPENLVSGTSPLRIDSCCRLGCLHQQEAQQGIALFADVPQSLFASTGLLIRNHAHVRADLLAAVKTLRSSDDQHIGECRKRTHAGMRHQSQHFGSARWRLVPRGSSAALPWEGLATWNSPATATVGLSRFRV